MSGSETDTHDRPEPEGGFLETLTPLTGANPNLGSFFLVVGAVSCVFIAVFQFTLPENIAFLLTVGVLLVTILSAIVASLLETLGHFDPPRVEAPVEEVEETTPRNVKPWTPTSDKRYPLPPMINFDDELQAYYEMFDGELPEQFDEFVTEYKRLKTTNNNRITIASDLRADLNPISVMFEDGSKGEEIYEEISERLFRYIDNDAIDHLALTDVGLYDDDGNRVTVEEVKNELARIRANVHNEGEAAKVEVVVEFFNGDGVSVRRDTCPLGEISPGGTKTLDTNVYVPSLAKRAETTLRVASPGTRVADI
jgi:hypothetical protein